eukprot:366439-Rhodomonas_salina.1
MALRTPYPICYYPLPPPSALRTPYAVGNTVLRTCYAMSGAFLRTHASIGGVGAAEPDDRATGLPQHRTGPPSLFKLARTCTLLTRTCARGPQTVNESYLPTNEVTLPPRRAMWGVGGGAAVPGVSG